MFTKNRKLVHVRIMFMMIFVIIMNSIVPYQAATIVYALGDSPGSLDATFDSDGLVTTSIGSYGAWGEALAIQEDGKIVLAGFQSTNGYDNFAVVRYNKDGSPDTSFDMDGSVITNFGGFSNDVGQDVAIQSDGKIVVVGYSFDLNPRTIALARYNTDGSLDGGFDMDGKVITDIGVAADSGHSLVIQPDDKIIVAGYTQVDWQNFEIVLVRYNTDGSLDATFDVDGIVKTSISSGGTVGGYSMIIQPDGKIIVGGTTTDSYEKFVLARYNSDGSLDTSFDVDGIATLYFNGPVGSIIDIFLQNDKVVFAGKGLENALYLARYNNDGSLDTTFDLDGKVITNFDYDVAFGGLVVQPSGKIIVAGSGKQIADYDFLLIRYNENGLLDTGFGADGMLRTDFGINQNDFADHIVIQSNGKLVVGGSRFNGSINEFAVARYLGDKTVRYVKWDASGLNNGSSWTDAYTDLQSALSTASSGQDIWVAAGTYRPTTGTDRTVSFTLKNGVAIYGGFAGTETLVTQRDFQTNITILSGDIGIEGNNSDNSYHVVVGDNTDATAVLNGFTVTKGNAHGPLDNDWGGGISVINGSPSLANLVITANDAKAGGGMLINDSNLVMKNITFSGNTATSAGGLFNLAGSPTLKNVTFKGNIASNVGGGIGNSNSNPILENVTFYGNMADTGAGMYTYGSPILKNVTFSGNIASNVGGGLYNESSNPTITSSIFWNNTGGEIENFDENMPNVSYSVVQGGYAGTGNLNVDPLLGSLADNGGFTQTMALGIGSPAINAGDDETCSETDQRGVTRPQGSHCDIGAYEYDSTDLGVMIGGDLKGSYSVGLSQSIRQSYSLNSGPVKVVSTNAVPFVVAERYAWLLNGVVQSFSEMMGLPGNQVTDTYYFPWYNNVTMDTQLRFANLGNTATNITVTIAGVPQTPIPLAAGVSTRVSYPGINNGPVKVQSSGGVPIIVAERDAWLVNGVVQSFSEMMGLPGNQVTDTYYFPWYNNVTMDTQLRLANLGNTSTNITVTIAGVAKPAIQLAPGQSTRVSYPINNGPVKVTSSGGVPIIVAERDAWLINGVVRSFSEMMGLPGNQLTTTYHFPWYNNVTMDTQLRFANLGNTSTDITVTIAGVAQPPITVAAGTSTRISYAGINNGPVTVTSMGGVPIIVAERDAWLLNGAVRSFSEMMGLPGNQLATTYYFPWYNNLTMDTQLRFAVP